MAGDSDLRALQHHRPLQTAKMCLCNKGPVWQASKPVATVPATAARETHCLMHSSSLGLPCKAQVTGRANRNSQSKEEGPIAAAGQMMP